MNKFLERHPQFDKVFCRSCNTLKPREDMHTQFRCEDCYLFARRAYHRKRYERLRLAELERIEIERMAREAEKAAAAALPAKPKRRYTPHLTMADKAEICEDHFGFDIQIPEIAARRNLSHVTVGKVISQYLGTGTPVTMVIPFDTQ